MFDWNDEELTNIIWGEAAESDDHIVPYQEGTEKYCNKKEWSEQSTIVKPTEQTLHEAKANLHEKNPVNDSSFNPNEEISTSEFRMDTWSELSISNTSELNQDTNGAKPSSNLSEITKYSSSCVGGTNVFDKEHVLENLHEGKDQGDFADYSWDNVGSFDDLDRIFSNDEPMFGNVNLPSADELWSSSKDGDSPGKSFNTSGDSMRLGLGVSRTRTLNQNVEINTHCKQEVDHSFYLSYGSMVDPTSHVLKSIEYAGNKSRFEPKEQANVKIGGKASATKSRPIAVRVSVPNKVVDKSCMPPYGQKKVSRYQKRADETAEGKPVHDIHGSWSPSGSPMGLSGNRLAFSSSKTSPSSAMCQQTQPQVSDCVPQKQIGDTFIGHATYGNINPYQAVPLVSRVQLNKGVTRTSTMTPQEKIEKLKRRQQMRALLAIQKQQQQFSHQVPLANPSLALSGTQEGQIRRVEGPDIEQTGTLHSFDPSSPYEQDDYNTVSLTIDDSSGEFKVLHRLQDVISKLDVRIRLCIRDSLFRLAQSAIQRHYGSDTSSSNKGGREEPEVFVMEKTTGQDRAGDTETETNPTDRTVAHLLFHQPLEFSVKHPDTPESPASCKLSGGLKTGNIVNPAMQCTPKGGFAQPHITFQGSENLCSIADITNPCMDNLDYTSNYVSNTEGGAVKANEGRSKSEAL